MRSSAQRTDEARKLIERLVKISPDKGMAERAQRLLNQVKLPMSVVLDKVPGDTTIQKAANLKVTRQTIYYWLYGVTRPKEKHARRLAAITGFDVNEIRGRASD